MTFSKPLLGTNTKKTKFLGWNTTGTLVSFKVGITAGLPLRTGPT
jgi:hypothetical protein